MTGLVEMASVPQMRASNSSGNRPDRPSSDSFSRSSWRRDSGDKKKTNTDYVVLNGLRVDCDLSSNIQDYNCNKSPDTMCDVDETFTVVDSHNIVSIQNNPFFKSFGIKTSHRDSRNDEASRTSGQVSSSVKENDSVFQDAEEQEYHPGTGFVHKLMDKFSSLSSKEEQSYHPKRTASLENLIADTSVKHTGLHKASKDDIGSKPIRTRQLSTGTLIADSRINHRTRPQKPLRVPVAPFKQSVYDADEEKKKVRSPRNSFEPADVNLGRQDIVIIETTTPISPRIDTTEPMSPTPDHSSKGVEGMDFKDELPKPNTVINVRSFFESKKDKKAPLPPPPPVSVSLVHPSSPTIVDQPPSLKKPSIPTRPVVNLSKDTKQSTSIKTSDTTKSLSPRQTEQNYSSITSNSPRYNAKTVASVAPYRDETEDNTVSSTGAGLLIFTSKPATKPRNVQPYKTEFINKPVENRNSSNLNEKKLEVINKSESSVSSKVTKTATELVETPLTDTNVQEPNDHICNNDTTKEIEENGAPVKGVPTFIANRRKKEAELRLGVGHQQNSFVSRSSPDREQSVESLKFKSDNAGDSDSVSKYIAPPPSSSNFSDSLQNGTSELETARKNIENARSKNQSQGVSMVFDSSQLTVKKRTPITSSNNVPRLDLSSITNDVTMNGHYQEGYKPTEIKPCRIEFIGAMVKLERSLLEKTNVKKGKLSFNDDKTVMFEYPSEEFLLAEYLVEHPEEKTELLLLPDLNSESNESTDDDFPDTPRDSIATNHNGMVTDIDDVIKSNTSLSHSGGLSSYRAKYQQEFQFGSSMNQPEPVKPVASVSEQGDPDSMQMMPADMDDTINWSSGGSSDLLF